MWAKTEDDMVNASRRRGGGSKALRSGGTAVDEKELTGQIHDEAARFRHESRADMKQHGDNGRMHAVVL